MPTEQEKTVHIIGNRSEACLQAGDLHEDLADSGVVLPYSAVQL